jgi:uncharacterized protein YbjQ (UPF0145 family)
VYNGGNSAFGVHWSQKMSPELVVPLNGGSPRYFTTGRVIVILVSIIALFLSLIASVLSVSGNSNGDLLESSSIPGDSVPASILTLKHVGLNIQNVDAKLKVPKLIDKQRRLRLLLTNALSDGLVGKNEAGVMGQTKLRNIEPVAHIERLKENAPEKGADGIAGTARRDAFTAGGITNAEPAIRTLAPAEPASDGLVGKNEAGVMGQTKLRNIEPVAHIKRLKENAPEKGADGIAGFAGSRDVVNLLNQNPVIGIRRTESPNSELHGNDGMGGYDEVGAIGRQNLLNLFPVIGVDNSKHVITASSGRSDDSIAALDSSFSGDSLVGRPAVQDFSRTWRLAVANQLRDEELVRKELAVVGAGQQVFGYRLLQKKKGFKDGAR